MNDATHEERLREIGQRFEALGPCPPHLEKTDAEFLWDELARLEAENTRLLDIFRAMKSGLHNMMEHEDEHSMLQMAVMVSAFANAAFPPTADDIAWAAQYLAATQGAPAAYTSLDWVEQFQDQWDD